MNDICKDCIKKCKFAAYPVELTNCDQKEETNKMSTPKDQKDLWKNCVWKSGEEKKAFFNHYFKNSDIVAAHMKATIDANNETLLNFITEGKIKENGKERSITLTDVIIRLKEV